MDSLWLMNLYIIYMDSLGLNKLYEQLHVHAGILCFEPGPGTRGGCAGLAESLTKAKLYYIMHLSATLARGL